MTTLASLIQMGGFVSSELVQKTITWPRGHLGMEDVDITVWLRPQSFATFEQAQTADAGQRVATKIAKCTGWGDDGSESITAEQVSKLDVALVAAIHAAIDGLSKPAGNG